MAKVKKQNNSLHPAEQYMRDVLSDKVPACEIVKNACRRQQRDLSLAESGKSPYVFNPAYAIHVINFFKTLKHYKGKYAGKPFILEPWQQFIIWCVFGWRKGAPNGPRRFRYIYIEVPKKNGKTTLLAGISLYAAFFDNEYAADVYTAATKRDQAKIAFLDARNMVKGSPMLNKHIKIQANSIFSAANESKVQPLSNDHDTTDGINVHCAIVDELHRHKNSEMVDLIEASISARRQPMVWEITTAGSNKQSVCYEHHSYTEAVNKGEKKDDTWFGLIYTLDKGDDWRDPKSWHKANPNLGTGKDVEYLEGRVQKARNLARLENSVKRYEFNIWTSSEEKWISEDVWLRNVRTRTDEELTAPGVCAYGGLDLGSTRDFNAFTITFENEEAGWKHTKEFYWVPKNMVDQRVEQNNIGYHEWVSGGWLKLMPGNAIDPSIIGDDIANLCQKYNVISTAYDPYNARDVVARLINEGVECNEIGQNMRAQSWPAKKLEADIYTGKVTHEGNPVTTWMMGNVVVYTDPSGNIKLKKNANDSPDKIDGPVSMVMSEAERLDKTLNEDENYDDLEIIMI